MKKVISILVLVIATGCNFEEQDTIETQSARTSCSASDTDYIKTDFDCLSYSIEYHFCDPAQEQDREGCLEMHEAPESFLTHCESYNVCEGYPNNQQ